MDYSTLSPQAMQELLEKLTAENVALKNRGVKITLRVSQKGAVSAYGLGRYPVTLYRKQWLRLLAAKEGILAYLDENAAYLSPDKED